ncbi:MAG: toxin co-regulated pilus biosynthesis Q family protein [Alphaproteobacteria bacterium]|nr:toxin co-regulated pilus biosynthesis Q family protein [Alphaproteobacteria bacterium]
MRENFDIEKTKNNLGVMGMLFCALSVSACISNVSIADEECVNGICTSDQEYTAVCTETPDGYSVCSEPGPREVNYTRTQADFRTYGERTPRDYRITQSGAGNNISAVVRPSIDDEVVDYESKVASAQVQSPAAQGQAAAQLPNGQPVAQTPAQMAAESLNPNQNPVPQEYKAANNVNTNNSTPSSEESDKNKDWLAEEGQSLKDLLSAWSEEAGWRLIWKTNRNYTLNAGAMFRGNFADVASALVRAFARARPAPIATFYKGNRVLVVETMEDENAYD